MYTKLFLEKPQYKMQSNIYTLLDCEKKASDDSTLLKHLINQFIEYQIENFTGRVYPYCSIYSISENEPEYKILIQFSTYRTIVDYFTRNINKTIEEFNNILKSFKVIELSTIYSNLFDKSNLTPYELNMDFDVFYILLDIKEDKKSLYFDFINNSDFENIILLKAKLIKSESEKLLRKIDKKLQAHDIHSIEIEQFETYDEYNNYESILVKRKSYHRSNDIDGRINEFRSSLINSIFNCYDKECYCDYDRPKKLLSFHNSCNKEIVTIYKYIIKLDKPYLENYIIDFSIISAIVMQIFNKQIGLMMYISSNNENDNEKQDDEYIYCTIYRNEKIKEISKYYDDKRIVNPVGCEDRNRANNLSRFDIKQFKENINNLNSH